MIKIGNNTWINPENVNYIRPSGDTRKWIVTFNHGNLVIDEMEFRELLQELVTPVEPVVVTTTEGSLFGGEKVITYGTTKFG